MIKKDVIPKEWLPLLESKLQGRTEDITIPPPVLEAMKGELLEYDLEKATLKVRFPVLSSQLNPYGNMQGGIIAAAIDNAIGPLSMLVSPPNFTRHMEVKYGRVVAPELGYIYVTARYVEKKKRQLFFAADVEDCEGNRLASAKSKHWVID